MKTVKSKLQKFFKENENKVFSLKELNEELTKIYPDENLYINRSIRDLPKRGFIEEMGGYVTKPSRGHYKFVKGLAPSFKKSPFSQAMKKKILKRDNFRCSWCGCPETKDNPLHIDHLIAEDKGGKGVYENGAVFCTKCNITKSNLDITSFGRKAFEKYLHISKKEKDDVTSNFLEEILKVFDKYERH